MGYGTQGALSGAGKGAAYGTMVMPGWGTAIGAVVGGLAGYFGGRSKSKKEKEERALKQKMIDENRAALGKKRTQATNILKALRAATKQGEGDYTSYLNLEDVPQEYLERAPEKDAGWASGLMEGAGNYFNSPASMPSQQSSGRTPSVSWGDKGLGTGDFSEFQSDPLGYKKQPSYFGLG